MSASPDAAAAMRRVTGAAVIITPRMAMAYSAGLLLAEDRFYGADGQDPPVLPFLSTRWEWPLALAFRDRLGLRPEDLARGVHAQQDTEIHRPFRIGETIQVVGDFVEARDTRAGALTRVRYEARSLTFGDVATTSWSTAIYRGVSLDAPAFAWARPSPMAPAAEAGARDEIQIEFPVHIAHAYSECAAIWNPIHTEEPVARAAGLDRTIVHGAILWALAGVKVADLRLEGDLKRLKRLSGRFQTPVFPGAVCRLIVFGVGDALGWRLEDVESGVVHVLGDARIASA